MKKLHAFFLMILASGLLLFVFRSSIREAAYEFMKPTLPAPMSLTEFTAKTPALLPAAQMGAVHADTVQSTIPGSINLAIPFASQAPLADWGEPYQEACEEAAVIMVHYYLTGKTLTPQLMNDEILKLVAWENKTFGYYKDTTAEDITRILREYFGHTHTQLRSPFTIEDLKNDLAQGHPVIVPAAGRLLGNPNFHQPGPLYHALVVKGYTPEKFITNDPGTRLGNNYLYDFDVLMNAAHDWNPQDILQGRKVLVIVAR